MNPGDLVKIVRSDGTYIGTVIDIRDPDIDTQVCKIDVDNKVIYAMETEVEELTQEERECWAVMKS